MKLIKKFSGQYLLLCIFFTFLIFTIITSFIFQLSKIAEYKAEKSQINENIKLVENDINELEGIISNDTEDNIEKLARERLGMVRSDERVYMVK